MTTADHRVIWSIAKLLFSFDGRVSRSTFWWTYLAFLVAGSATVSPDKLGQKLTAAVTPLRTSHPVVRQFT
jgi:uncharacterized membrane protein YhaH (DUF805 family)